MAWWLYWIMNQPYSWVEDNGFRRLLTCWNKDIIPYQRKHLWGQLFLKSISMSDHTIAQLSATKSYHLQNVWSSRSLDHYSPFTFLYLSEDFICILTLWKKTESCLSNCKYYSGITRAQYGAVQKVRTRFRGEGCKESDIVWQGGGAVSVLVTYPTHWKFF